MPPVGDKPIGPRARLPLPWGGGTLVGEPALRLSPQIITDPGGIRKDFCYAFLGFWWSFQRVRAAFLAICLRRLAESFSALALPPFSPPSRPRDTAAGFFWGVDWVSSPAILATIPAA